MNDEERNEDFGRNRAQTFDSFVSETESRFGTFDVHSNANQTHESTLPAFQLEEEEESDVSVILHPTIFLSKVNDALTLNTLTNKLLKTEDYKAPTSNKFQFSSLPEKRQKVLKNYALEAQFIEAVQQNSRQSTDSDKG